MIVFPVISIVADTKLNEGEVVICGVLVGHTGITQFQVEEISMLMPTLVALHAIQFCPQTKVTVKFNFDELKFVRKPLYDCIRDFPTNIW